MLNDITNTEWIHLAIACLLTGMIFGALTLEWFYKSVIASQQDEIDDCNRVIDELHREHPCCDPAQIFGQHHQIIGIDC